VAKPVQLVNFDRYSFKSAISKMWRLEAISQLGKVQRFNAIMTEDLL